MIRLQTPLSLLLAVGCALTWSCLVLVGCKSQPAPDLLKGKWKVVHVLSGSQEYGGPTFQGADFHFRENGTVLVTQASGDTTVSRYEQRGDTLIYLKPDGQERYHVDSLTANKMVITADLQGMPTRIRMQRLMEAAKE
jgi:hypothetical protein